jgi:AraC family ethanolamine operon transcriptional activator
MRAVVASYRNASTYHAGTTPPDLWTFSFPLRMFASGRLNARPWLGEAWLFKGGQPFDALLPPIDLLILQVDPAILASRCDAPGRAQLVRWWEAGGATLPSSEARLVAKDTFRSLLRAIDVHEDAPTALLAQAIGRGLLRPLEPSHDEALTVVRRTRQFAVAHRHRPIQVAELCEVLDLPRRKLQYCFRTVLDTTPLHYMHALRLGGARRSLLQGAPTVRVRAAALEWGFAHLGRFSDDYRRLFGELPSETVRRAPTIC